MYRSKPCANTSRTRQIRGTVLHLLEPWPSSRQGRLLRTLLQDDGPVPGQGCSQSHPGAGCCFTMCKRSAARPARHRDPGGLWLSPGTGMVACPEPTGARDSGQRASAPRACWPGSLSGTITVPKTHFCGDPQTACADRNKRKSERNQAGPPAQSG